MLGGFWNAPISLALKFMVDESNPFLSQAKNPEVNHLIQDVYMMCHYDKEYKGALINYGLGWVGDLAAGIC